MKGSRALPCVTSVARSLPLPGALAAVGTCSSPVPAPQHRDPKLPPLGTPRGGASTWGQRGKPSLLHPPATWGLSRLTSTQTYGHPALLPVPCGCSGPKYHRHPQPGQDGGSKPPRQPLGSAGDTGRGLGARGHIRAPSAATGSTSSISRCSGSATASISSGRRSSTPSTSWWTSTGPPPSPRSSRSSSGTTTRAQRCHRGGCGAERGGVERGRGQRTVPQGGGDTQESLVHAKLCPGAVIVEVKRGARSWVRGEMGASEGQGAQGALLTAGTGALHPGVPWGPPLHPGSPCLSPWQDLLRSQP